MKKFFMLFALVAFVGVSAATAQCTKSKTTCTKSKTTCTKAKASATTVSAEMPACPTKAAAKLASMDESIQAKTCASSGKTTYYQKNVCSTSGKVYMKEVQYDAKSQSFVNVSPKDGAAKAVKAVDGAAPAKKACSASKKACTSKKASCTSKKTSCTKKASTSEVKLVKEVKAVDQK